MAYNPYQQGGGAPPAQNPYGQQPAYGQQPGYAAPYGQHPPPGGPQAAPRGYPSQPPASYGGQPPASYGGQPPATYGGQPPAGYGAPPAAAYGGQPTGGYGGQPPPGAPPGVDPTIASWFTAVDADRSGKVTATELQQALTNGNWSHFNAETCRLMIGLFDKDQSGTIDIYEFGALWKYIQDWKGCFDRYDRDRSGHVEANELYNAFNDMGYRLSIQFSQMIVTKFDRVAKRALKLDDFIQACVMLRSLTDAFRQRDTNQSGTVQMSYEDFMSLALLNKS